MKTKLESLHLTLNELTKEIGAITIGSWSYTDKLTIHCDYNGLRNYIVENKLSFTDVKVNYIESDGVKYDKVSFNTNSFKLFALISEEERENKI